MSKRPHYYSENFDEQYQINDNIGHPTYVQQPPLKRFHFNNDLLFEATVTCHSEPDLAKNDVFISNANYRTFEKSYTPAAPHFQKIKSMPSLSNEIMVKAMELEINAYVQEDSNMSTNHESLVYDTPAAAFPSHELPSEISMPLSNQRNNSTSSSSSSSSSLPPVIPSKLHPIEPTQSSKKLIHDYFRHRSSPTMESAFLNKNNFSRNRNSDSVTNKGTTENIGCTIHEKMQLQEGEEVITNSDCHCRVCNAVVNNADYDVQSACASSSSNLNTKVKKIAANCFQRCGYCTRSSCLLTCSMACESCRELFCKFCIAVDYTSDYERILCPDCNR